MLEEEWEEIIDPDTGEPDWVVTGYHWESMGEDTLYWTGYYYEWENNQVIKRYAGEEQIGTGDYGYVGLGWSKMYGTIEPIYEDIDNP